MGCFPTPNANSEIVWTAIPGYLPMPAHRPWSHNDRPWWTRVIDRIKGRR